MPLRDVYQIIVFLRYNDKATSGGIASRDAVFPQEEGDSGSIFLKNAVDLLDRFEQILHITRPPPDEPSKQD